MLRTRLLSLLVVPACAAFLGTAAFHVAWGAPQGQSMDMSAMSRGGMSMAARHVGSQPAIDVPAPGISAASHFTVYVLPGGDGLGFTGPDKIHHDTLVPSSFVLRKGVPVTFTVINLDDMTHSITAPGLGVNIVIKPGVNGRDGRLVPSATTYTFIPAKVGEFRWYCVFPCDMPQHWAMSASYDGPDRDGFMAGIIRVL